MRPEMMPISHSDSALAADFRSKRMATTNYVGVQHTSVDLIMRIALDIISKPTFSPVGSPPDIRHCADGWVAIVGAHSGMH